MIEVVCTMAAASRSTHEVKAIFNVLSLAATSDRDKARLEAELSRVGEELAIPRGRVLRAQIGEFPSVPVPVS